MTRIFAIGLVASLWTSSALAQLIRIDDPPPFSAFAEIGGNGFLPANIDVLVQPHLSLRAGGIVVPLTDEWVPWSGVLMLIRAGFTPIWAPIRGGSRREQLDHRVVFSDESNVDSDVWCQRRTDVLIALRTRRPP